MVLVCRKLDHMLMKCKNVALIIAKRSNDIYVINYNIQCDYIFVMYDLQKCDYTFRSFFLE